MIRLLAPAQPSTQSWETFNDLHYWLRQCQQTHFKCLERRISCSQLQLPTRLLYVPAFAAGSVVALCESSNIPRCTRYVTLSHCWGNITDQMRLLTTNYEQFKKGIAISSLPRTFRDAIGVAVALGISYLWVDSLCIIQDAQEDWARECSPMSDVYGGSFLNIGANCATNSYGGLFRQRDPQMVNAVCKSISFQPNLWEDEPFAILPDGANATKAIHNGPLFHRAWVIQEALLSPRTVHFTKHKVVWQCSSLIASETDVTGQLEPDEGSGLILWPMMRRNLTTPQRATQCLEKWELAVRMYTRVKLTFPSDKLVAISGIAKHIYDLWDDPQVQYYAGLWSYQLEWQLLWHGGPHVAEYRAPSWSWASVDGEASSPFFYPDKMEYLSRVLEVSVNATSGIPFGPVSSGYIKIRGPMCTVLSVYRDTEGENQETDERIATLMSSEHPVRFRQFMLDEPQWVEPTDLYLLAVVKQLDVMYTPAMGIILQPFGNARGEFKRVGMFEINDEIPHTVEQDKFYASWESLVWPGSTPRTALNRRKDDYVNLQIAFEAMDLSDSHFVTRDIQAKEYEIIVI